MRKAQGTRDKSKKAKGAKKAKKRVRIEDLASKRDEAVRGGLADPTTGAVYASRR